MFRVVKIFKIQYLLPVSTYIAVFWIASVSEKLKGFSSISRPLESQKKSCSSPKLKKKYKKPKSEITQSLSNMLHIEHCIKR